MAQKLEQKNQLTVTREASAALSKYLFVRLNASDAAKIDQCDTVGEQVFGLLDVDVESADLAKVIYSGIGIVLAGEALAAGDAVMSGANGRAYKWDGSGARAGFCTTTASAAADQVSIIVAPQAGAANAARQIKQLHITFADGTTETDTGWDLPAKAIVHDVYLDVTVAEATGATKTIDVGTDGTGSNDPNGWLAGVSVAATGLVKGTLLNTGQTRGALLAVDEDGSATLVPEIDIASGGESVTWTPGSSDYAELVADIYIEYTEIVA
jgi:hypothetical protein